MGMHFGLEAAFTPPVVAGSTTTTGAVSQSITIPNTANGVQARCVMVTATGNAYIKFTQGAGTATNTDFMLPANQPLAFNCQQFNTISLLEETAGAKVNVVPIEV